MSKKHEGDCRTSEYWDARVKASANRDDMIFIDGRRQEFWKRVWEQLDAWKNHEVVDVACGFGKFSKAFPPTRYRGIDFSAEMLQIARVENPGVVFDQVDAKAVQSFPKVDVIFEVNSLKSLGMTAEEFINKFRPYARVAVACLEADRFTVEQVYPKG